MFLEELAKNEFCKCINKFGVHAVFRFFKALVNSLSIDTFRLGRPPPTCPWPLILRDVWSDLCVHICHV